MARSAEQLAQRRQVLVLRSAMLRDALNADLRGIEPAFTVVDRAQDAWIWLRAKPLAALLPLVAIGVVWAVRKPSRLVTLPLRAWSLWRLWRRVAPQLR
jgi:hypothetical protein